MFFFFIIPFLPCSATQQIPLCETRFNVSSGDTSFVIKDQMAWSPSENGTGTNGQGFVPNLPKSGPKQNSSPTVEETYIRYLYF